MTYEWISFIYLWGNNPTSFFDRKINLLVFFEGVNEHVDGGELADEA